MMNADWEQSKENIKPLKQGRQMSLLSSGLASLQDGDNIEQLKRSTQLVIF
jgi:hypothetical protein